jgi:hypothetical protein
MARRLLVLLALTLGVTSSVAYAASLNVSSWHLWAGSQTLTKATCTVTGAAVDTYVDESNPASSFSTATYIGTRTGSGVRAFTYIRFDLSTCAIPATGGADSATLNLFISTAPTTNRTITVTPVLSTWAGTLTWTQAQSLTLGSATTTFTTGTTSNVTKSATVTVDVDQLIKSGTANYGWRLADLGGTSATTLISSTESATNKPQLVINYEK